MAFGFGPKSKAQGGALGARVAQARTMPPPPAANPAMQRPMMGMGDTPQLGPQGPKAGGMPQRKKFFGKF